MSRLRRGSAKVRARWPKAAHALPFALAAIAMAVLGPLAAIAVGQSSQSGGVGLTGTTNTKTKTTKTGTTQTGTTKTTQTGTSVTVTTVTGTKTTVHVYPAPTPTAPAPAVDKVPRSSPFSRRAMWIWVVDSTDGGNVARIIEQAKADGVGTLFIKSGDGTSNWPQFNSTLVTELHAAGLKVCAWQYVYGSSPAGEAAVGDDAIKEGADCLLIDAETQYQGRYVQAQTYIRDLRALAGRNYPLGLAGFPYVGYHLSFPYSVFLGPGGAQYNVPQMYWYDIGTSVPDVYSVTYAYNEIYKRPVFPIGQLYPGSLTGKAPPTTQIELFNTLARSYHALGTSWYDWQSATGSGLGAISKFGKKPKGFERTTTAATVAYGQLGDLVVWAQEYLDGWLNAKFGKSSLITVDGDFGRKTRAAVKLFQADHGIDPTGIINGTTWDALLKVTPLSITWVSKKGKLSSTDQSRALTRGGAVLQSLPLSAKLRAKRNELHGNVGQGRP